jgi:hypothetical protein
MLHLVIALLFSLLTNAIICVLFIRQIGNLNKLHYQEKEEIFNRYMATDYKTYRYFKDEAPLLLDDLKKNQEKERERTRTKEEAEREEVASRF